MEAQRAHKAAMIRLCESPMTRGGAIGSPGTSAFWYTAVTVPRVHFPSARWLDIPIRNGWTYRPWNCSVKNTNSRFVFQILYMANHDQAGVQFSWNIIHAATYL